MRLAVGLIVFALVMLIGLALYADRNIKSCVDPCAPYAVNTWRDDGSCLCDTTIVVRGGKR